MMSVFLYITACFIFSEVNAGFFYKSAEERERLVAAERKFSDDRVQKVIELKRKVIIALFYIDGLCFQVSYKQLLLLVIMLYLSFDWIEP